MRRIALCAILKELNGMGVYYQHHVPLQLSPLFTSVVYCGSLSDSKDTASRSAELRSQQHRGKPVRAAVEIFQILG